MSSKVTFALFGLGRMGVTHLKHIMTSPRASVKWIIRNQIQEAEMFVKDFNLSAKCTTPDNLQPVYNDPEVNAVLICSPTGTHAGIIKDSLNAGKAVFCEKPVTPDIDSTSECYDLAQRQNKPLLCAFHRRFDPSVTQLYEHVRRQDLGNVRVIKSVSREIQPPPISYIKTSGGIFADSTIHDLDLCRWVSGSRPQTVYAQGNAFEPEIAECNDLDHVLVTIKFENGVIANIDNGRVDGYGYDNRLEALCDKGMFCVDNRQTNLLTEHGSSVTSVPRMDADFGTRYLDAYANEIEHFIDVMQDKSEIRVKKEDTVQAMKLVEACNKSVQTLQPVQFEQ